MKKVCAVAFVNKSVRNKTYCEMHYGEAVAVQVKLVDVKAHYRFFATTEEMWNEMVYSKVHKVYDKVTFHNVDDLPEQQKTA